MLNDNFEKYQQRLENALKKYLLTQKNNSPRLLDAMRYAVLSGGKRIRACLVYTTGFSCGLAIEKLDGLACAIEIIHAYSLVHDDLPAMDDDDLRRGKPSCHKAFDEATAILAGDALQTLAFDIIAGMDTSAEKKVLMIKQLTKAIGVEGMAGGQAMDLTLMHTKLSNTELEHIHTLKTGKLFAACVVMAVTMAGCNENKIAYFESFANHLGLAFQIKDDVLDIEACSESLGKPQGSDLKNNKATYPSISGMDSAKKRILELRESALIELDKIDMDTTMLRELTELIIDRKY